MQFEALIIDKSRFLIIYFYIRKEEFGVQSNMIPNENEEINVIL